MNVKYKLVLGVFALFCFAFIYSCKETPFQQGKILYEYYCANCHMEDGSGLEGLIPPVAGAD